MGTTHLDGLQVSGVPTMGVNPLPLANNYWFVSSLIGSNGFPGNSYTQPFATLAFAASSTNNPSLAVGDCIVVMEGHAETIAAAGGVTLNTVGLYVVGLGSGAYRPTFTFATSTAATFLISAASTSVSNIIGVTGIDQVVSPFSITAAGVSLGTTAYGYVEYQDPSSALQAVRPVLTSTAADNLIINLKVIGITSGGTSPVNGVRLVGCNSGLVNIDFYGRASTAVVEFFTGAASTNIEVYGYMYNSGVTNYTKDVVDTVTGSTWFASFYDGAAGYAISGGSGTALGPAQAATVIADLAVPSTDSTANLLERDVVGSKADTAVVVTSSTASEIAYLKTILTGSPKVAAKVIASAAATLTTGSSPVTLFTVTGDHIVKVWATVQTALTSTSSNGTLSVGTTGVVTSLLGTTTVDGTNLHTANGVWAGDTSPGGATSKVLSAAALTGVVVSGSNIICTVATNSMTAGAITFYCQWTPLTASATVVAA